MKTKKKTSPKKKVAKKKTPAKKKVSTQQISVPEPAPINDGYVAARIRRIFVYVVSVDVGLHGDEFFTEDADTAIKVQEILREVCPVVAIKKVWGIWIKVDQDRNHQPMLHVMDNRQRGSYGKSMLDDVIRSAKSLRDIIYKKQLSQKGL